MKKQFLTHTLLWLTDSANPSQISKIHQDQLFRPSFHPILPLETLECHVLSHCTANDNSVNFMGKWRAIHPCGILSTAIPRDKPAEITLVEIITQCHAQLKSQYPMLAAHQLAHGSSMTVVVEFADLTILLKDSVQRSLSQSSGNNGID